MIGIPVGLLYANAGEWFIHKYVLHGMGKRRSSWWSFHFHEHHQAARRNDMRDADYALPPLDKSAQRKEVYGLLGLVALHLPLAPVAPLFTATIAYSAVRYYRLHKRSHLDPDWAREHLPWHVDHHMGPNQDCNWGVTRPWFDQLLGTRVPYVGTPREAQDRARATKRAAERTAATLQTSPPAGGLAA